MKIKSTVMALLILVFIFGGIGATMALGYWTTTSDKTPATYKDGDFAGQSNPADIRGSYTFADIAASFQLDARTLLTAFGFPDSQDPAKVKAKDLETRYAGLPEEIGTGSVRLFVALYKNLPIDLDGTWLPKPAIPLIEAANPRLTAEQKAYLASHALDLGTASAPGEPAGPETTASNPAAISTTPSATSEAPAATANPAAVTAATEPVVNGTATFQQLLDAGITREQIEQVLGAPLPPTNQSVRDYCSSKGISFSSVKNALNALVPAR